MGEIIMSGYISKRALIEYFEKMDDECNLFRWRSAKKIKQGLKSIIARQPTVDEKEIIRKTVERIVGRMEELEPQYLGVEYTDGVCDAIEIVKEVGGTSD